MPARQLHIFIQARMRSSRLPGKVLRSLGSKPVLDHVVQRARAAGPAVAVLTSDRDSDDALAQHAERAGIPYFRGPEEDVLERFRRAAEYFGADPVVRLTADNPFIDPAVITACIDWHRRGGHELSSTRELRGPEVARRTAPIGMSVDVLEAGALARAARQAREPWEREHVIPVFFSGGFRVSLIDLGLGPADLAHRFSIDTEEDWRRAERLIDKVGEDAPLAHLVRAGAGT